MKISKRLSRDAQFRIEQAAFKAVYHTCRALPSKFILNQGLKLGSLAWRLGIRTETTKKNIQLAVGGDLSDAEIERIAKEAYLHYGEELVRIMRLDLEARRPLEGWIDIDGVDVVRNRQSSGGVLVGGHIGCWEIGNLLLPKMGEPITLFTGKHANKRAGKWVDDIRTNAGARTLSAFDDRTELYKRAKTEVVALLGDLKPPKAPVQVKFFGRETAAAQGGPLLALLNKVDFIYFSCVKVGDKLKARFKKIDYSTENSRKENIKLLAQGFFNELEVDIKNYPEQYFWMHRRWKDNPDVQYEDKEALL